VDKCIGCCFYDRQHGNNTDSRGVSWGQCRRTAPALHPVNQKSFMIEGVWPHVRDDAMTPSTMLPIGTGASLGARPSNVAPFSSGNARSEQPVSLGPLMSTARGAD